MENSMFLNDIQNDLVNSITLCEAQHFKDFIIKCQAIVKVQLYSARNIMCNN